jgi:hypothetical protein
MNRAFSFSAHRYYSAFSFPLGATWDGLGVNFALFSANAAKVVIFVGYGIRVCNSHNIIERPERLAAPNLVGIFRKFYALDLLLAFEIEKAELRLSE